MDLFDLFAKISMDNSEYYANLDDAGQKTSAFGNKLKSGLATAAKVGAAGLATAAAGVATLTKKSMENYAEYEQLAGGVETLFKDSSDTVLGYAQNAYKTARLTANGYMETVTSFSASLLQSLDGDTAKAAEVADMAITDMADNANKMGSSIETIQNAYQGFAKQNYTMLDNLKLGYGGTKEEMQRLIDDANRVKEANGEMADLSIESFADITDAIHIIQTEMGITGTTAAETSSTITGSVDSAKSAWSNLVTGIADENADLELLVDNFVDSAATAAENILPRVGIILDRMGDVLEEKGPDMVVGGAKLLGKLAVGAVKAIPDVVKSIPKIVKAIADEFVESGPEFKEIGMDIVRGVWDGLSSMGKWLGNKVDSFFDGIVGGVKDFLGIHSPSRVFAGIGENMAQGLGEGWDDEYDDVSKTIESGLDFGEAKVGFSSISKRPAGHFGSAGDGDNPITIIVQSVLDDKVIGETAYKYSKNRERAYGGA